MVCAQSNFHIYLANIEAVLQLVYASARYSFEVVRNPGRASGTGFDVPTCGFLHLALAHMTPWELERALQAIGNLEPALFKEVQERLGLNVSRLGAQTQDLVNSGGSKWRNLTFFFDSTSTTCSTCGHRLFFWRACNVCGRSFSNGSWDYMAYLPEDPSKGVRQRRAESLSFLKNLLNRLY